MTKLVTLTVSPSLDVNDTVAVASASGGQTVNGPQHASRRDRIP
jgi:hypothetical protein